MVHGGIRSGGETADIVLTRLGIVKQQPEAQTLVTSVACKLPAPAHPLTLINPTSTIFSVLIFGVSSID